MNYSSITMCALDFVRALRERGKFWNWIFRLAVGRYAFREFELMSANLEWSSLSPEFDYSLEDADYHKMTMRQIKEEWQNCNKKG